MSFHRGNEILFSKEEDKITPEEFAVSYMTVYTRYKEDTPSDATKLPHWLGKLIANFMALKFKNTTKLEKMFEHRIDDTLLTR